jgi:hypothetical protein
MAKLQPEHKPQPIEEPALVPIEETTKPKPKPTSNEDYDE